MADSVSRKTRQLLIKHQIHAASFRTNASQFDFLHSWQPVLRHPELELSEISIGGYKELYNMGVNYRWAYPDFYTENTPFVLWANRYEVSSLDQQ